MRTYIDLGSTPTNEDCAQVGSDRYTTMAHLECKALIGQLCRLFPEVNSLDFTIRSNLHDFGYYYTVVFIYDDNSETQTNLAYKLGDEIPYQWDDEAREWLQSKRYNLS